MDGPLAEAASLLPRQIFCIVRWNTQRIPTSDIIPLPFRYSPPDRLLLEFSLHTQCPSQYDFDKESCDLHIYQIDTLFQTIYYGSVGMHSSENGKEETSVPKLTWQSLQILSYSLPDCISHGMTNGTSHIECRISLLHISSLLHLSLGSFCYHMIFVHLSFTTD